MKREDELVPATPGALASDYVQEAVRERFLPSATEFATKLFGSVSTELVPHLAVLYVPVPGLRDNDAAWTVGLPADIRSALLLDLETAIAEREATNLAAASPSSGLAAVFGTQPRPAAIEGLVDARLAAATAHCREKWSPSSVVHGLACDFVCFVGLPRTAVDAVPAATLPRGERVTFLDHVVGEFVSCVAREVSQNSSPRFRFQPRTSAADILRDAGAAFVKRLMLTIEDKLLVALRNNAFEWLNQVAALRYEGAEGRGTIVFAREDDAELPIAMRFAEPAQLANAVWSRKLLELATPGIAVVASDDKVFGLVPSEKVLERLNVVFRGKHTWLLRQGRTDLLETRLGKPSLPRPPLRREDFNQALERVVSGEFDAERLWSVVAVAMKQTHGTLVVISRGTPCVNRVLDGVLWVPQTVARECERAISSEGAAVP